MPKLIKKWIVDKVDYRDFDIEVPISVDPKDGGFWAEYPPGEVIRRDDRTACREAVKTAIREANNLEWKQYIAVKTESRSHWHRTKANVSMDLFRFEKAVIKRETPHRWREGETVVTTIARYRPFGDTDHNRIGNQHSPHEHVVFPYDEALWERLKAIEATVIYVKEALQAILTKDQDETHDHVLARIMDPGLQLPGPVDTPAWEVPEEVVEGRKKRKKVPPPPPKRK